MRKDAAVGVDGVTKEPYGQALEDNLRDLVAVPGVGEADPRPYVADDPLLVASGLLRSAPPLSAIGLFSSRFRKSS